MAKFICLYYNKVKVLITISPLTLGPKFALLNVHNGALMQHV